jgi:hypothetical protein
MSFATSLNASLNDWLATVAASRKEALKRGARRFALLVSPTAELETLEIPAGIGADEAPAVALRITSGMHRGASMELTGSEYLVGSGDDCDVVLHDEAVSAHHCRLAREWSGFCVRDLRTGAPQLVTPQTVAFEGGAIDAGYEVGGVQFTLRQDPPRSKVARAQELRKQSVSWAILVVVILGVVLAIVAVTGAGRAVTQHPAALDRWIGVGDQALAAQGFGSVHFESDPRGDPQVKGLVSDTAEKQRLQTWLRGSPYSQAHLNVHLASDLIEQARRALADEALQVGLHDARLDIEGTTSRLELKARIRALMEDLRGTVPVEDRVQYLDAHDDTGPGPLPVTVSSVMVGNPSYFLTDEGTRYFVGGQLSDGAEVLSIDAAQIQFRLRGKVVTYELK